MLDNLRQGHHRHLADHQLQGQWVTADLTPFDADVPPISLGSERDYDWSPDGREIVYISDNGAAFTLWQNFTTTFLGNTTSI